MVVQARVRAKERWLLFNRLNAVAFVCKIYPKIKMKGMFWNSDGLGDTAKHLTITESVRDNKLDFVVLSETGRSNFATPFLNKVSGRLQYEWYYLPPHGRSGGILIRVNSTTLAVQNMVAGDFCVKLHVKSKADGFAWALVAFYGADQEEFKPNFLSELVCICDAETLPILVGGDFNLIRRQEEKNNDRFNARWPLVFYACCD